MADFYGSHFVYSGVSSRTYGLIFASIDEDRMLSGAGEMTAKRFFNKKSKQFYIVDDDYSNSGISFEIEIITDDEKPISGENVRKIEKWLFNKHNYRKLYLDTADHCLNETLISETIGGEEKKLYLNCRFINHSKIESGSGIIGFRATLEADSNMFWQDAITVTNTINSSSAQNLSTFTVTTDSDSDDYIYPRITITMNSSGGDFTLINTTDDDSRLTKVLNIGASVVIVIDSRINYITDGYYEYFEGLNFPRLCNGENIINVIGNVTSVEVEFNNRRYLI